MLLKDNVEIVGILATTLVLVSFLMKGERKIRLFNIFGAVLFVAYGILINSFSVWFMNLVLIGIHVCRLYIIEQQKKFLTSKLSTLYTHDNKYIKPVKEEEQ